MLIDLTSEQTRLVLTLTEMSAALIIIRSEIPEPTAKVTGLSGNDQTRLIIVAFCSEESPEQMKESLIRISSWRYSKFS
jgi:hypothetical protein